MKRFFFLFFTLLSFTQLKSNDINWNAPITLSGAMVNASDPQIVIDASGNITTAWVENGFIKTSVQPSGGSFGTTRTLSNSGASSPKLKLDGSGNVTAVWIEGGVVKTATMPPNGSWSGATTLSSSGASSPVLGVNASGGTVVVWVRNGFIESKTKTILGLWSLVSILSAANSDNPDVFISANGRIIAVWHSLVGASDIVYSATQILGGVWGPAVNILPAASAFSHNYPKISIDSDGDADVIWYRYTVTGGVYTGVYVYSASLPNGSSSWSFPLQISDTGIRNPADFALKIRHDATGNAMAIWSMSYDNSTFTIEAATKSESNGWGAFAQITFNNEYAFRSDLSINALNEALITYMEYDGSNVTIYATESNIDAFLGNIGFTPPIALSTGQNNGYPKVASEYDGTTLYAGAVWLYSDGVNTSVQVATGSRDPVEPPTDVTVTQATNNFGVFVDYTNTISWTPSSSPNISEYIVFRNGVLLTQVDGSTTQVLDHNGAQNGSVTYGIVAVDNEASVSPMVIVNFP